MKHLKRFPFLEEEEVKKKPVKITYHPGGGVDEGKRIRIVYLFTPLTLFSPWPIGGHR